MNEVGCAIEWVNDPGVLRLPGIDCRLLTGLFSKKTMLRIGSFESINNCSFCRLIDFRDKIVVVLS